MVDELAGLSPGGGEAESHEHVVEPALEQAQEVLAGRAFALRRHREVALELPLEHAVGAAQLLLLAQLLAIIGHPHPGLHAVLAGLGVELALGVERATRALQEEVSAFPSRQLAFGSEVSSHYSLPVESENLLSTDLVS